MIERINSLLDKSDELIKAAAVNTVHGIGVSLENTLIAAPGLFIWAPQAAVLALGYPALLMGDTLANSIGAMLGVEMPK